VFAYGDLHPTAICIQEHFDRSTLTRERLGCHLIELDNRFLEFALELDRALDVETA
jgi:hypothetical protein